MSGDLLGMAHGLAARGQRKAFLSRVRRMGLSEFVQGIEQAMEQMPPDEIRRALLLRVAGSLFFVGTLDSFNKRAASAMEKLEWLAQRGWAEMLVESACSSLAVGTPAVHARMLALLDKGGCAKLLAELALNRDCYAEEVGSAKLDGYMKMALTRYRMLCGSDAVDLAPVAGFVKKDLSSGWRAADDEAEGAALAYVRSMALSVEEKIGLEKVLAGAAAPCYQAASAL